MESSEIGKWKFSQTFLFTLFSRSSLTRECLSLRSSLWMFVFPFLYAFISFTFQGWIRYGSFYSGRTPGALVKIIEYSKFLIILGSASKNYQIFEILNQSRYFSMLRYFTSNLTLRLTLPTLPYPTLCLTLLLTLPYFVLPYLTLRFILPYRRSYLTSYLPYALPYLTPYLIWP